MRNARRRRKSASNDPARHAPLLGCCKQAGGGRRGDSENQRGRRHKCSGLAGAAARPLRIHSACLHRQLAGPATARQHALPRRQHGRCGRSPALRFRSEPTGGPGRHRHHRRTRLVPTGSAGVPAGGPPAPGPPRAVRALVAGLAAAPTSGSLGHHPACGARAAGLGPWARGGAGHRRHLVGRCHAAGPANAFAPATGQPVAFSTTLGAARHPDGRAGHLRGLRPAAMGASARPAAIGPAAGRPRHAALRLGGDRTRSPSRCRGPSRPTPATARRRDHPH